MNEEKTVGQEQVQSISEQELVDLSIREVSLDDIQAIEETFVPAWGFGCGAGC